MAVIHDTVQNLDKKFDALRGKVAKIHRLHVKSLWQSRKPLRSAYRNYNYLPSRRNRCRKTKKKKDTCSLFSEPKSYSPTVPVRRPNTDYQYDFLDTTYPSEQESPERDPELIYQEWEMRMNQSQSPPADSTAEPSQPGCTPNLVQGDYLGTPCRGSPRAHSSASLLSPKEPSTGMPETPVTQAYPSPPYNPEVTAHLSSLENHSFGHIDADFRNPGNFVTSTPIVNNPGMPYNFPDDPSTWSVNEVVLFLEQADPQTLGPVADIFRQHEIDGKALLLLKSDMMLNYMGLKLGITVKVCHHIDRLRGQKYINN
ncbi:sex comb on midleg-like protein 1 [Suricata suricatta]|uniref:sex comb on midleg-like protein 1 n=1 Tax=Suricata suricatta TaxID=37032 RepID=UPI00115556C0|nr:sex comb on midleg-like protein 1 [Suricata suricatta]